MRWKGVMIMEETVKVLVEIPKNMYEKIINKNNVFYSKIIANGTIITNEQGWIPVSEGLPEYGVAVLTYDGNCYSVEKRIPTIRDDNGEPISGEWWVSDDYDESNSEYYPNLRDGACIAWMPLPKPYEVTP